MHKGKGIYANRLNKKRYYAPHGHISFLFRKASYKVYVSLDDAYEGEHLNAKKFYFLRSCQ